MTPGYLALVNLVNVGMLPAGWRETHRSKHSAGFAYGERLRLEIEPRRASSRGRDQQPILRYRVILWKRVYAHQPKGEPTIIGTAEGFAEALEVATAYMATFGEDRTAAAMELQTGDPAEPTAAKHADDAIVNAATSKAAIELAGYSDPMFLSQLRDILGVRDEDRPVLQAVVHRDGDAYDVAFVAEGFESWLDDQSVVFEPQVARSEPLGAAIVHMRSSDATRLLRFTAGPHDETAVLLDPRHPVQLPYVERGIVDLLAASSEE